MRAPRRTLASALAVAALLLGLPLAIPAIASSPERFPVAPARPSANAAAHEARRYERARDNAFDPIRRSLVAPGPVAPPPAALPVPSDRSAPSELDASYVIGDELPPTPANAQRYVALAHRAMATCVAMTAADDEYRDAVAALDARRYRVAMAASRNVVDDCAGH